MLSIAGRGASRIVLTPTTSPGAVTQTRALPIFQSQCSRAASVGRRYRSGGREGASRRRSPASGVSTSFLRGSMLTEHSGEVSGLAARVETESTLASGWSSDLWFLVSRMRRLSGDEKHCAHLSLPRSNYVLRGSRNTKVERSAFRLVGFSQFGLSSRPECGPDFVVRSKFVAAMDL